MSALRIGARNRRIELMAPARAGDGGGGATLSYALAHAAWARIERLSATRVDGRRARRVAATLRLREGVVPGWRFSVAGAEYEIVSVESADGRFMTLTGEEAL